MRILLCICYTFIVLACNNDQKQMTEPAITSASDTSVLESKPQAEQNRFNQEEFRIVDTGQTWFCKI